MTRIVGIDPGDEGALALFEWGSPKESIIMPTLSSGIDGSEVARVLREWNPDGIAIERAQAMPGQGVCSMFTYGTGYGVLLGVIMTLKIPLLTVPPRTWQAWAQKKFGGKKQADPKAQALAWVKTFYPQASLIPPRCRVPHKGIVDALLIAGWHDATK